MDRLKKIGWFCLVVLASLQGCVTQNYSDQDKPVVERDFSNHDKAMTRITLGLGYLNMGNTSQAKLNLERAKQYAPKLVDVYTAFAYYYEVVDEPSQAEQAYKQALSLAPQNADALNNYGVFLCRQKRPAEAEQYWLKAIAVPSYIKVAESYQNIALCLLEDNRFTQAESYLKKALDHSPNNASIIYQQMQLAYAKRDWAEAERLIKRYERVTRQFDPAFIALAYKIYHKQNSLETARNYATMLVKMFPASAESKAFINDGLKSIQADELAQRYQAQFVSATSEDSEQSATKKVIKFSPKKPQASTTEVAVDQQATRQTEPQNTTPASDVTTSQAEHALPVQVAESDAPQPRPLSSYQLGESAQLPETAGKSAVAKTDAMTPEQAMMTLPVHVMQKGESLFTVSKKYNITMRALEKWNHLKRSDKLQIGQVIYLADPKKAVEL